MATALKLTANSLASDFQHTQQLAQLLSTQLKQLKGVHFKGDQHQKLAAIINVFFAEYRH